jgi:hypothetical protein
MPKAPKAPSSSSTTRRLELAAHIDLFGDIMPVACRNCRDAGLVCKVHIQSGRCNECNRKNSKTCNIRISASEWAVIRAERERLLARREELKKEEAELDRALKENAERAAEAIAVEEANIVLLEQREAAVAPSDGLALSPFTWSAVEGWSDDVWSAGVPAYLGETLGGPGAAGQPTSERSQGKLSPNYFAGFIVSFSSFLRSRVLGKVVLFAIFPEFLLTGL